MTNVIYGWPLPCWLIGRFCPKFNKQNFFCCCTLLKTEHNFFGWVQLFPEPSFTESLPSVTSSKDHSLYFLFAILISPVKRLQVQSLYVKELGAGPIMHWIFIISRISRNSCRQSSTKSKTVFSWPDILWSWKGFWVLRPSLHVPFHGITSRYSYTLLV
mgnify:CR=1 FL=1